MGDGGLHLTQMVKCLSHSMRGTPSCNVTASSPFGSGGGPNSQFPGQGDSRNWKKRPVFGAVHGEIHWFNSILGRNPKQVLCTPFPKGVQCCALLFKRSAVLCTPFSQNNNFQKVFFPGAGVAVVGKQAWTTPQPSLPLWGASLSTNPLGV